MKNKKGFTLVEILGVITILGVLALIAIPTIDNIVTKNREKLYNSQIKTIEDGLKTWGNANAMSLPEDGDDALLITIGILKLAGFVDEDMKNPNTNLCFSNDMMLSISAEKGGYTYYIDEESGLDGTEADCSSPTGTEFLYLKGGSAVELELGDTYEEPGFIALSASGNIVAGSVAQVIKDKNGSVVGIVDTSESNLAPYTITYTYGTATITRTINVVGYTVYANGTIVYFNPVTGAKCTSGEAVSTPGTKTGCMKWHIFNDNSTKSTVDMILDHNTTSTIAWNTSGSSVSGPSQLLTQLNSDTSSWTGVSTRTDSYTYNDGTSNYTINYSSNKARLITATEIAAITGNSNFNENTTTDWFYFDSNNQTQTATTIGSSNYAWLFNYTNNCTSYGCNIASTASWAYWTATAGAGASTNAWIAHSQGRIIPIVVTNTDGRGVRPVITIPKSSL